MAFQNAVLRIPKRIDYSAMPRATFVDPEVATVGLSEAEARDQHPEVRTFRAEFADLDRARIDGRTEGFAKLVATPAGKILGATIVGENASLILQEFVLAMEHGLTLNDIAATVHIYPTYAGMAGKLANQFAATRLEGGFLMTALRWFYGFPSRDAANGETAPASPRPSTDMPSSRWSTPGGPGIDPPGNEPQKGPRIGRCRQSSSKSSSSSC